MGDGRPPLVVFGLPFACDVFLWGFTAAHPFLAERRAGSLVVAGAGAGLVLCLSYYSALADQLSPKGVFESYGRRHK